MQGGIGQEANGFLTTAGTTRLLLSMSVFMLKHILTVHKLGGRLHRENVRVMATVEPVTVYVFHVAATQM